MTSESLVDKVISLHRALAKKKVPHAFGGALALAYCTSEPRTTRDIDVNLFVTEDQAAVVFAALPLGVAYSDRDVARARRDGQQRLWWGTTPVDLFFGYHEFHEHAHRHARQVRFANTTIPVLDGADLVVFKAFFNRPKDWVDIAAVAEANGADLDAALRWVTELLGHDDPRAMRLAGLAAHTP